MSDEQLPAEPIDVHEWAAQVEGDVVALAEMLGAPVGDVREDPLVLWPYLQSYVSRLPLDEFEDGDKWRLLTQLSQYLAQTLVVRRGATWRVVEDPDSAVGFRFVIELPNASGEQRTIDPVAVALDEFRRPPIEIARMFANAEVAAGLTNLDQ